MLKELFQQEFSKMVAVISSLFGLQHIEIAEDIVSETFLQAAETWGIKGIPPNPTAWLYTVAKQKTLYHFRRDKLFEKKMIPALKAQQEQVVTTGEDRLFRAKERLRESGVKMELPPVHEIDKRLDNVLHIIYLLFNEGYYSRTQNRILQKELCFEAMHVGVLLTEWERTCRPKTNALMALMCFHASRFHARQANEETLILYEQQDETLWDSALISQGRYFLDLSMQGTELSSYHIEARIAGWHCIKEDSPEKWADILQLYDQLLLINYSPSVALNRTFALYKVRGAQEALIDAEKLKLENNHFYFLLLGELYKGIDPEKARSGFERAYSLARTQPERKSIKEKIDTL
jgi:predicted RNA polymerase sigma factor